MIVRIARFSVILAFTYYDAAQCPGRALALPQSREKIACLFFLTPLGVFINSIDMICTFKINYFSLIYHLAGVMQSNVAGVQHHLCELVY